MIDASYYEDEDDTNNGKDKVVASVTPENADELMNYINNLNR